MKSEILLAKAQYSRHGFPYSKLPM